MSGAIKIEITDVLVVVDIQIDFLPGGALAVPDGYAIIPVVNRIAALFDHVVLTQDWHPVDHSSFASAHQAKNPYDTVTLPYGEQILWPSHCVQGTFGADFHPELAVNRSQLIIRKGYNREIDSYSTFFENDRKTPTGLDGYLKEMGIKRIYMAGLATDFCVLYSTLDARNLGYETYVIEDACRGIDMDGSLAAAWGSMSEAGVHRIKESDLTK